MATRKPAPPTEKPGLTGQVRERLDSLWKIAGSATDLGLALAQARIQQPGQRKALAKAGVVIKQWRESAGMTAAEVAQAIGLGDASLLELAEGGRTALPTELVLRLAGVLGRHDPITAAMALTRQTNPELWQALEGLGLGKLALQTGRERELANLYRGNDSARQLDDERFARVLDFTRQAFEMAVALSVPAPASQAKAAVRTTGSQAVAKAGTAKASAGARRARKAQA